MFDPWNGNIIHVNNEFGGASASWVFSSSGKLYMCGYYGPDLFIMGTDGTTIARKPSLTDQYYWTQELKFTTGNNLAVFYGAKNGGYEVNYPYIIDVTDYFGIIEHGWK